MIIRQKHLPPDSSDLGQSHNNIGVMYYRLGHADQALEHCNMSLKIYEKSLPSQHPSIGITLMNIGLAYEDKGNLQEALSCYERTAQIFRHSLPRTHLDVINIKKLIEHVSFKLK